MTLRSVVLLSVVAVACGSVLAAPPARLAPPRLELTVHDGMTRITVVAALADGTVSRTPLRETEAAVSAAAAGRDPGQAAAFVTWRESGEARPWEALSEDGGRHWHAARPQPDQLMLRDATPRPGEALPPSPAGLDAGGRLFIVQFKTTGIDAWRQALTEAGAELFHYLPYNAHLVRIDPARAAALRGLDFVARVEPYAAWYRLDQRLRDWLAAPGDPLEARRVNVLAFEWGLPGKTRIAAAVAALGGSVTNLPASSHRMDVLLTRAQLRQLAAHDDVQWLDPWSAPENDMDLVRQDNGADWTENNFGYCGQGVRAEVMDAGVEDTHQDFDGLISHGAHNVDSHGTSTYGINFGNGARDGDGEAKATGNAPCAQGIFADYDNLTDRFASTQELKHAPYFASYQSNSWGSARVRNYTSESQEMDDIAWRLDFLVFQSQSNAGNQDSRPQAWAKNLISIGGAYHYDTLDTSDDCWCSGASIGPAEDGSIKPDLAYWYDEIYTTTTGNGYTSGFNGTSAATPMTASTGALFFQMWSENVFGTDPVGNTVFERQPHTATMKALMLNTAQQYTFSGTTHDLTRVHQGWGRANLKNAKQRAAKSFIIDETVPLRLADKASYDITVDSGETELKVTLVYTDLPGTTSAALHRINDLDLTVTSPSGTVYHGNVGLDAGNYSTPGGTKNGKDTVENVFVKNPAAGTWKVEVEAAEINQDEYLATPDTDQVFGLVVTGGTGQVCAPPVADFTITPNPANVGQSVLFDSTVSGGAGAPFTYSWELDGDGVADATDADPTRVYSRPFAGDVTLRVKDATGCATTVKHTATVNGPDLRFADYVNLTEVQGNGNGSVDPGEVWDLTVRLKNRGNQAAGGVTASLVAAAGNAAPVSVIAGTLEFGSIGVNATAASSLTSRIQVGAGFPCGQDAVFSIVAIDSASPGNRYPDEVGSLHVLVGGAGAPVLFWKDGFETDRGWVFTGGGEWQEGAPQGKGTGSAPPGQPQPKPDPTSAFEGGKVLGNDLTGVGTYPGNYEALVDSAATSPVIDCSGAVQTTLTFERWLNIAPSDVAKFQVSGNGGSTWTTLYSISAGQPEGAWKLQSYDISAIADRSANVKLRYTIQTDGNLQLSGWNIDDIRLTAVTKDSCQPVARATAGETAGLTVTRGASTIDLAWSADCGGTSYAGIYRGDLALGYGSLAPVPGSCGVAGTSASIAPQPGISEFFLVVPNDGGFEGSYGATSSGARVPATHACHPRDGVNACAP